MKTLLTSILLLLSVHSFAQTDIIEMRSRNASLKSYKKSTRYDHVASNFGMAPTIEVRNAVLDSVKAISDTVSVMYTSNYCSTRNRFERNLDLEYMIDTNGRKQNIPSPTKVRPNPRVGDLWRAGVDTVINHPLFSQRHALDSVKRVLDEQYYFSLPSDSIRFIGFDNGQPIQNGDAVKPVKHQRKNTKNGFGWELFFMITTPIAFLLGMNKLKLIGVTDNP